MQAHQHCLACKTMNASSHRSRTRHLSAAILLAALAGAGCSTPPTNAQIGTGVGAVVGGAAGNVIFGSTLGTIGGAAAGALIGNEVGKNQRRR